MGEQASIFLSTFNRIEKWMRSELNNPSSMGFSEMVRRLSKRKDLRVKNYQDDLLQIALLRNAIVHDKIASDFVIAEPNEWVVSKLGMIENSLTHPESVIPGFKKHVTGFEKNTALTDILSIIAEKGYSQFPIYDNGEFLGLVTVHGLGLWLASQNRDSQIIVKGKTIEEVLRSDRRRNNYHFIGEDTFIFQALELFMDNPSLEAILITKDGHSSGNLKGIIRPKDVFENYSKERKKTE